MNQIKRAIYPGTFDPVTNGHIDLINRATDIFDEIVVTVAKNPGKTNLFTVQERVEMLTESLKYFSNVVVDSFDGLVVDHANQIGAMGIIRGLRAVSDFEYEFQMALMNRKLSNEIETLFLMAAMRWIYISSRIIKEVVTSGGCVNGLVPEPVELKLVEKLRPAVQTSL